MSIKTNLDIRYLKNRDVPVMENQVSQCKEKWAFFWRKVRISGMHADTVAFF